MSCISPSRPVSTGTPCCGDPKMKSTVSASQEASGGASKLPKDHKARRQAEQRRSIAVIVEARAGFL